MRMTVLRAVLVIYDLIVPPGGEYPDQATIKLPTTMGQGSNSCPVTHLLSYYDHRRRLLQLLWEQPAAKAIHSGMLCACSSMIRSVRVGFTVDSTRYLANYNYA
jgi:hypothetical protein